MSKKKIFVLDTNVLMHDSSSVFRFEEHDLFIPMVVLEELDGLKKGTSEPARTARQVSRLLDDLVADKDHDRLVPKLVLVERVEHAAELCVHETGAGAVGAEQLAPVLFVELGEGSGISAEADGLRRSGR